MTSSWQPRAGFRLRTVNGGQQSAETHGQDEVRRRGEDQGADRDAAVAQQQGPHDREDAQGSGEQRDAEYLTV